MMSETAEDPKHAGSLESDLEVALGRIIELHGFSAVRKALDAWQAEDARHNAGKLPETISIERLRSNGGRT